jgi:hypothetical protein
LKRCIKSDLREKQRSLSFDKGIDKINPVEIERDFEGAILETCSRLVVYSFVKIP